MEISNNVINQKYIMDQQCHKTKIKKVGGGGGGQHIEKNTLQWREHWNDNDDDDDNK